MFKAKPEKLIKKLSGHNLFYDDRENSGYKFFARLNDMFDISILVYHPTDLTYREYIVDMANFLAIYEFADDLNFNVHKRFTKPGARPVPVRSLVDDGYSVIKVGDSKLIKSYVVAKMYEYRKSDDEKIKSLSLQRLVFKPVTGSPLIGADILTLPHYVARAFVAYARTVFKEIDIDENLKEELND